jgi:hypothetical protein
MKNHLQGLFFGDIKALSDDSRVKTLGNVSFSLFQELSDHQNIGSGAVAGDFVLSGSSTSNHGRRWILNLLAFLASEFYSDQDKTPELEAKKKPFRRARLCRLW